VVSTVGAGVLVSASFFSGVVPLLHDTIKIIATNAKQETSSLRVLLVIVKDLVYKVTDYILFDQKNYTVAIR